MTLRYVDVDEVGLGGERVEVGAVQLGGEQGAVSLGEAELAAIGGDGHLTLLAEEVGEGVTLSHRQGEVLRQAEDRGAEVGAADASGSSPMRRMSLCLWDRGSSPGCPV